MLKIILGTGILLLTSCGQVFNSNSNDLNIYASDCASSGSPEYAAPCLIIKDQCISCHSGYHDKWASWKTSADWVSNGIVVAGDPNGSQLIYRMKNFQGGADSNMPEGLPQIPDDEYNTLVDWIEAL